MLVGALNTIRTNRLADWMACELVGNATPKVLLVRTKAEMLDEALTQYGGDIVFVGGAALLNKALAHLPRLLKLPVNAATTPWLIAGRSIATLSAISTGYLALPHIRNFITLHVTGTRNYAEMIGEKTKRHKTDKEKQAEGRASLKKALIPLVAELAILGVTLPVTAMAMKKQWALPGVLKLFNKHLALKGGDIKDIPRISQYLFWGLAAYIAYGLAATDKYERQEVALKATAFTMGFQVVPKLVEPAIKGWVDKWKSVPKFIGSKANAAYGLEYLATILTLGCLPPLLNIYLTHQRIKRENEQAAQQTTLSVATAQLLNNQPVNPLPKAPANKPTPLQTTRITPEVTQPIATAYSTPTWAVQAQSNLGTVPISPESLRQTAIGLTPSTLSHSNITTSTSGYQASETPAAAIIRTPYGFVEAAN